MRAAAAASARSAGNVLILELRAERLFEPDDGAVLDEVDEALEAALDADREIEHGRARAEAVLDHADAHVEIGAGAVELVDEAHPRDLVLLGLAPDGLGLRLDAGNAVEAGDRAVEDAQRALDLDGEVDVARRVDDVDAVLGALPSPAFQKQVVAALVIVIPRSCSCSIQSMVAVPSWTSPIL
jgi:hypothetical protein